MPKENPKLSKDAFIQIRININEKEIWEKYANENKFPSISQLIRFCVNEVMESGLKRTIKNNQISKQEELQRFEDLYNEIKQGRLESMKMIKETLSEIRNTRESKVEYKIKDRILKLLKKHRYEYEDISEIFNVPESDVLILLNELEQKNVIRQNKKMEYEVVNDKNPK